MATAEKTVFYASKEEEGQRLDKLLAIHFPTYSRTYFEQLIQQGCVLVNGEVCKKRHQPQEEDEIEVLFTLREAPDLTPENIPLEILYEDEHLLAVNKPAGMVVHPAPGHPNHTFVNALLFHCDLSHHDTLRPGIVHRLDKDTSGVLLAAKTEHAHTQLVSLFSSRKIDKYYLAIAYGKIDDGLIDLPIGRHPKDRKKMAISSPYARSAQTLCTTLRFKKDLSLVKLQLLTGRTHQIRVHLSASQAPILGDPLYGSPKANALYAAKRQLLHAQSIHFLHPILKIPLHLEAPLPQDFLLALNFFES